MRPRPWSPPEAFTPTEETFVARLRRRSRFFVFLRQIRHELLSAELQADLAALYQDQVRGQPPIPPGQLLLATLLQAYTGVSDADVIEAIVSDRRWQLVLDCWEAEPAPFSQATLVHFRQRLIAKQLDRRVLEQVIALAETTGKFGRRQLKLALDSSPLWGAGRVEDTVNLLGTAVRRAVALVATQQGTTLAAQAAALGLPELGGASLKGQLDLDWTDPEAQAQALRIVLGALATVEAQVNREATPPSEPVAAHLAAARQVEAQDVTTTAAGQPVLREGVAANRRISIADADQRHGRKSKAVRFDGYKRHAVRDLEQAGVIRAVAVTPANRPDAEATAAIEADLAQQAVEVAEWHVDRAYLASRLVRDRADGTVIWCKPFPVHNRAQFPKTAFAFDAAAGQLTCPAGVVRPAAAGKTIHFPAERCAGCALRAQCTRSKPGQGRSLTLHPEEVLLSALRTAQASPEGRAKLRERVGVEHTEARLRQVQGETARYRGLRKQLFDTRRAATVINLQTLDSLRHPASPQPSLSIS